jgi:hypothetical protein
MSILDLSEQPPLSQPDGNNGGDWKIVPRHFYLRSNRAAFIRGRNINAPLVRYLGALLYVV